MDIKKEIDNYNASEIEYLEGLEGVRKRPAMYIGSTKVYGLHHLVWEIVDNAVDESLNGFGNKITVIIRNDGSITVQDEGRGIPVDIPCTVVVNLMNKPINLVLDFMVLVVL